MFFMAGSGDKDSTVIGAFINIFVIGLFIFRVDFPVKGWLKGLLIGLLLNLPDTIIIKAHGPII